jgi:hypothetical protein
MSLSASPQVLALPAGSSAPITFTSSEQDLATITFSGAPAGTISFVAGAASVAAQTWTVYAPTNGYIGTFTVTATDTVSQDTTTFVVSIPPAVPAVVGGRGALEAITDVQLRTNETIPTINGLALGTLTGVQAALFMLNTGLQEVVRRIGGIKLQGTYPTVPNQTVQALTADVQDIVSCSWSTGGPQAQGALVYPMIAMDQAMFMDFSAGFPAVGSGPPTSYFVFADQNGTQIMQLYPAAMLGQLNVYYRARPIAWTLLSNGTDGVSTNLDPSAQEAVILWTCARVCQMRGRLADAGTFDTACTTLAPPIDLVSTLQRRTEPRSGQVRDLGGRLFPGLWWQS